MLNRTRVRGLVSGELVMEMLEFRRLMTLQAASSVAVAMDYGFYPLPNVDNRLTLDFEDTNGIPAETGYVIQRNVPGTGWVTFDTVAAMPGLNHVSRTYHELRGDEYQLRVQTLGDTEPIYSSTARNASAKSEFVPMTARRIVINGTPTIALQWQPYNIATDVFELSRRPYSPQGGDWDTLATNLTEVTTYLDDDVTAGVLYEYRIDRQVNEVTHHFGYVPASLNIAPVERMEDRGTVLLVIESGKATAIADELDLFETQLIGDGWTVQRLLFARESGDSSDRHDAAELKAGIASSYVGDPESLKMILLIGHLPVPYSGTYALFDGHGDHQGAHPADVFYADVFADYEDDPWTDDLPRSNALGNTNIGNPITAEGSNAQGDGKFDVNHLGPETPGYNTFNYSHEAVVPRVAVGRIDFSSLPGTESSFPTAPSDLEVALLKRYFDKEARWRMGEVNDVLLNQAVVDDHLGPSTWHSSNMWRSFSSFVGVDDVLSRDWYTEYRSIHNLENNTYLWAGGWGPGTFASSAGIAAADQFHYTSVSYNAVFSMMFGSYFADWDKPNGLLREMIGARGNTLIALSGARPHWFLHPMGMGETIGNVLLSTQNDLPDNPDKSYLPNSDRYQAQGVHLSVMGDPTLRMHVVKPADRVLVFDGQEGGIEWDESPDSGVLGYHVYKADEMSSAFTRLSTSIVTGTEFYDPTWTGDDCVYMVRAVKLESTPSGTYYNLSQGAFGEWDNGGAEELGYSSGSGSYSAFAGSGSSSGTASSATVRIFDELGDIWNGSAGALASTSGTGSGGTGTSSTVPVAGWSSSHPLNVDVSINESGDHKLSLGFGSTSAGQVVRVVDPESGRVYATQTVGSSSTGQTLHFKVRGQVRVIISNPAGGTVQLAGMRVVRVN